MTTDDLDVLLIEDNPADARLIEEMLRDGEQLLQRIDVGGSTAGVPEIHHDERLSPALDRLADGAVDVVLLDLGLPDSSGLDTLASVIEATEFVPVVVLTGLRDEQVGIEAIQRGAQDYLVKDEVTSDLLVRSIHHAIERNRQERERARRREQLELLNRLTRDVMEAETPTDVSEYVVEAAEGGLDLPVTAIALYDDQEGTLRLAETTDVAAEVLDATRLLDERDGPAWRAFTTNESRRTAGPFEGTDSSIPAPVTELAILPLGKHGVFITGSVATDGFSQTDFDFVETIAGNLEAAFDRVDRERQLHERERTLEEQNQALERLNRVNDIIRNIARALVHVSSREELEAVVCEQLADVGPYELAWFGEHDAATEELRLRESAGNAKGYLDEITVRIDDSPEGEGPGGRAVKTGEPQVVNDVLEDRLFEPWRQAALNRGYHAVIALPLVYEDTTHGVLVVYAGQPGMFDNLEQAVLTELADTIAFAISTIGSANGPATTEVTRLTFAVADSDLAIAEMTRDLDCAFTVENLVPDADGGMRGFFLTRGASPDAVREYAPRLPIRDLLLISEREEDGESVCLFQARLTDDSMAAVLPERGGHLRSVDADEGTARIAVELPADTDDQQFVDAFRSQYPDAELVTRETRERPCLSPLEYRASLTEMLTDRQLEALQTAYSTGYFEEPRTRTAREIADTMDISQPTFNSHLRAAQRKLFGKLFRDEPVEY